MNNESTHFAEDVLQHLLLHLFLLLLHYIISGLEAGLEDLRGDPGRHLRLNCIHELEVYISEFARFHLLVEK
jgi:hypothetical protein